MKTLLGFSLLGLLFFSGCDLNDFLPKAKDKVEIAIDAPASGVAWQKKAINCQEKNDLCEDLPILLQQSDFPKRQETLPQALGDDYQKLKEKAQFSREFESTKGSTSLPSGRSDSYSFPVSGAELTVVIAGSVAEVKNTLRSPGGQVYNADTFNASHEKTDYLERFIIPDPAQGRWTLVADNISDSKPVYSLVFETFVLRQRANIKGVSIKAEVRDDGEVILQGRGAGKDTSYEWELGDGFAGVGPVVGHDYAPGKYIPKLILLREGVGEGVVSASFYIRKKKEDLPEIINVNSSGKRLPSPPKILSAKREGKWITLRSLPGNPNGGPEIVYDYSRDGGSSWQEVSLLAGKFLVPFEEETRLVFRSRNKRGSGSQGLMICNWSGYYPLEAKARGIVDGEKINLYLRSGGCPGERWNIIAPLWKKAGIF